MLSFGYALLWFALGGFVYSVLSKFITGARQMYNVRQVFIQFIEIVVWMEREIDISEGNRMFVRKFIVDWIKTIEPELFKTDILKFDTWDEMVNFERENNENKTFKDTK